MPWLSTVQTESLGPGAPIDKIEHAIAFNLSDREIGTRDPLRQDRA
jgi:hypothetical protein